MVTDGSERAGADEVLHPALIALLRLAPGPAVHLPAVVVASVCGFSGALVASLLWQARREVCEWADAAEMAEVEGDPEEARVCQVEAAAWRCTADDLRAALALFV